MEYFAARFIIGVDARASALEINLSTLSEAIDQGIVRYDRVT